MCARSRMNEVFHVERVLFSKMHFLVGDDKHVIVQVFSRFEKGSSGLVMSILARRTVSPK